MPNYRPRISILTALLLVTILCMAIVIAHLWREVGSLRAERRDLREETGRLFIDDPGKLYAIEVRSGFPLTWRWRVWVPDGETADVRVQWGHVPKTGIGQTSSSSIQLRPGDHWISLSAAFDEKTKQWRSELDTEDTADGAIIQPDEHWFDLKHCGAAMNGVGNATCEAEPTEKTIVLTRYRADPAISSTFDPNGPTRGFIIWLERH